MKFPAFSRNGALGFLIGYFVLSKLFLGTIELNPNMLFDTIMGMVGAILLGLALGYLNREKEK